MYLLSSSLYSSFSDTSLEFGCGVLLDPTWSILKAPQAQGQDLLNINCRSADFRDLFDSMILALSEEPDAETLAKCSKVLRDNKPIHDFLKYREPCVRFTLLNVLALLSTQRLRNFVEAFLDSNPAFPDFVQMDPSTLAKNVKKLELKILPLKVDSEEEHAV